MLLFVKGAGRPLNQGRVIAWEPSEARVRDRMIAGMTRSLGRAIRFDRFNPGFGPPQVAHIEVDLCLKILALEGLGA